MLCSPPTRYRQMPDEELSRSPIFQCRLCGQAIQQAAKLFMTASWVAHISCLERRRSVQGLAVAPNTAAPLTDDERSRLFRFCWSHKVAVCRGCNQTYRVNELGADLFRGQYYLCPFCRVDLTSSIRQHIRACTVARQDDPEWQAEV